MFTTCRRVLTCVQSDQREFTRNLYNADFQVSKNLNRLNGKNKLDATGLKTLRGTNGSLQWLVSNTRVDLAAKVLLSAREASNPTTASLQKKANKLVRQAHRDDAVPIHIHSISLDHLTFDIFSDAS